MKFLKDNPVYGGWYFFICFEKEILFGDNIVMVLRMASVISGGNLPSHNSVLKSNVTILAKDLVTELKKISGAARYPVTVVTRKIPVGYQARFLNEILNSNIKREEN